MTRPRVNHDGFLVPNAGDVANPKMAEPDRIDFSTVGNNRWGVVKDCLVTVSGATASTLGGVAVVNGALVEVNAGSALLGVGAGQDRFDLVVTDPNGTIKVIPGEPSTDPVFPDPEVDATVLAAVFCPSGVNNFVDYVIDKRNWLSDALLTKIPPTYPLLQNLNGNGNHYLVTGDGHQTWEGDAHIYRVAAETLRIIRHLILDGNMVAGGNISAVDIIASGTLTGSNLQQIDGPPADPSPGDLWQESDTGRIYTWQNGAWEELATIAGAVPVGSIIQSLEDPTTMIAKGWYPLNGQPVARTTATESLFAIPALAPFIDGDVLTMPNASGRVLISDFAAPGRLGGSSEVVLTRDNMPSHDHGITMGNGGAHTHNVVVNQGGAHSHTVSGGAHTHGVSDDGHRHGAAEGPGGVHVSVIAVVWGGQNKIDALFNDRSHTYSVEQMAWTKAATAGIQINSANSNHGHTVNQHPGHTHLASSDAHPGHTHPLSVLPVGQGAPVDIVQPYLTVYTYIRS